MNVGSEIYLGSKKEAKDIKNFRFLAYYCYTYNEFDKKIKEHKIEIVKCHWHSNIIGLLVHEILHSVLLGRIGLEESRKFDNIDCYDSGYIGLIHNIVT